MQVLLLVIRKLLKGLMRNVNIKNKIVLINADILSHFFTSELIELLRKLFGDNLYLLDVAEEELCRKRGTVFQAQISNLKRLGLLKKYVFPTDNALIAKEYFRLKKTFSNGESACLSIAKHTYDFIVNTNSDNVKVFCIENRIEYLSTMDILLLAYNNEIISEANCDYYIYLIKSAGGQIPYWTLNDFINNG